MKQITALISTALVLTAFCAAQAPSTGAFQQEGIASWYGSEFDGRSTASGEVFRSSLFTAAHPTLPFGTLLLVTNLHNYRQVVVRVNDRGPFVPARIIDVSKAAAEKLDMVVTGTAPVLVEITNIPAGYYGQGAVPDPGASLTYAPVITNPSLLPAIQPIQQVPAPAAQPPVHESEPAMLPLVPSLPAAPAAELKPALPSLSSGKIYRIQVGAYRVARNAVETFDRLKGCGLSPAYERNGDMYRVVLSGIKAEDVPLVAERLGAAGFNEAFIREER